MTTKWIIEKDVWHPKEEACLVEALTKLGFEYKLVESIPFVKDPNLKKRFPEEDCVIASGSIQFNVDVQRETTWIPGTYATFKNYECSNYYPYLGNLLLNSEYVFVPYGDLTRLNKMLIEKFGSNNAVFIRPDSGKKLFKGKVVTLENWKSEMDECEMWGVGRNDMVLVSFPRNVSREWRFFVADKRVFTGCMYKSYGLLKEDIELNKKAEELAQKAAYIYQPDSCFSIDICQVDENEMKVLEFNAATSAGMYDCDIEKIVLEFSRVALLEHKDYFEDLNSPKVDV